MKKYSKQILSLMLIALLLFFYAVYPAATFAQTATDTPTPTADNSQSTPTPTAAPSSTTTPTDTPSPTIDPNASPTPTPTIDPNATVTDTPAPSDPSNTATVDNTATGSAVTGDNSLTATSSADTSGGGGSSGGNNSSSSGGGSSGASIATGDALSEINSDTGVNVNSINSNVIVQTLNIFVAQDGSINLSDPFTIAAEAIQSHPDQPVINVAVTNVNNFAYITDEVASEAITGDNSVTAADQSASITSGNAYSIISLLNKVNFTIDNSTIHIVTINIFGTLNGNIILPDLNASTNCSSCGIDIAANNNATVNNNVTSTADTGNNTATGGSNITTGNADSAVNNVNLINTNLFGSTAEVLFINDFGLWTGNFIGWGDIGPATGGASLAFFNLIPGSSSSGSGTCSSCGLDSIDNGAVVTNNVSSLADSGGNLLNGNGSITTGNAYSAVSLINFINSNFLDSIGFFGFINIFGNWTGDIGGASEFAALDALNNNASSDPVSVTPQSSSTTSVQESGGQLAVKNSNNTGAFVYPGDTVTLFIKTTNTGTGKVYGAKLNLYLIYQGSLSGGTQFSLGDIQPGHTVEVDTGFVLSKLALPGAYIIRAYATGNVGPDNSAVSATADSSFTVFGALGGINPNPHGPKTVVLGAKTGSFNKASANKTAEDLLYFSLLALTAFAYISIRLIRKREYIAAYFQSETFKEKIYTLRMFLL